ncbi:MAG: succinylglutamate desuccinylase/aspartoacylase family protein [Pseudomonadales bacterium]|nr:succinylglutamate desuccinylase/aspartoacylase family protein [Pseudomonadales bacterium]MCP5185925.1 succinylglutamate desuccinylase/aspartoacylase family protein [Pseudomonadales bacterium]
MLTVYQPVAVPVQEPAPEYASIDLNRRLEAAQKSPPPPDSEEAEAPLNTIPESDDSVTADSEEDFATRVLRQGLDKAIAPDAANGTASASESAALPATPTPEFVLDRFLGEPFVPGTLTQRLWQAGQDFHGTTIPTPVLVNVGKEDGPTLCLTGAIHGDELNGIKAVHQIMYETDPDRLSGKLIGVPIVNLQGFQRQSRYLPDRRDLNRYFPGNQRGSSAARMAFSFFREVILYCDALVDLHTGSFHRTNLPQIRGDLTNDGVLKLTRGFGSMVILHGTGARGTLRFAATASGIPAVTLEAGEPLRVDESAVEDSVRAIQSLMYALGMTRKRVRAGTPEPYFYTTTWLRADGGGILSSQARLGEKVEAGDLLGTVTDPITNKVSKIRSTRNGRILGMAVNQFVMPGFAVYHLGLPTPREDIDLLPLDGMQDYSDDDGEFVDEGDHIHPLGNTVPLVPTIDGRFIPDPNATSKPAQTDKPANAETESEDDS